MSLSPQEKVFLGQEKVSLQKEMAQLLQSENETTDPPILRSRRMLMDALASLLIKKEFEDTSVQDIAAEATLNRVTFYLHYPDKNALLQAMTQSRFRDLIERRAITFNDCNGALRAIAFGVCDYLAESTGCLGQLARVPLEASIIPVVEGMFKEGLAQHSTRTRCRCSVGGYYRGLGRFWCRAPLVSDPHPYPRRGDGSPD